MSRLSAAARKMARAIATVCLACALVPLSLFAQSGIPPATANPSPLATPLRLSDPSTFPAARSEREAIERAILLAEPKSLDEADRLVSASRKLSVSELGALKAAIAACRQSLYPDALWNEPVLSTDWLSMERLPAQVAALLSGLPVFGPEGREHVARALEVAAILESGGFATVLPELLRARAEELEDRPSEAAGHYRAVLDTYPSVWPAALGLARCALSLHDYAAAAAAVDTLDPVSSSNPHILALSAEVLHESGRLPEAYVIATRYLFFGPGGATYQLIRAHFLVDSDEPVAAQEILSDFPKTEKHPRLYYELRAQVAQSMKNMDDMLSWAKEGLETYVDDPGLLVLAAKALFAGPESGFESARAYAATALDYPGTRNASPLESSRLERASREASGLLLAASTASNKWNEALTYMNLSGQLSVDRKTRAAVLRNSGKSQDAYVYSQTWIRDEPASEEALEAYLRALVLLGRTEEVRGRISTLRPDKASFHMRSFIYYLEGWLSAASSDHAEAMRHYRAAIFEEANNADALIALAELHFERKEFERSGFYYEQALGLPATEADISRRLALLGVALGSVRVEK